MKAGLKTNDTLNSGYSLNSLLKLPSQECVTRHKGEETKNEPSRVVANLLCIKLDAECLPYSSTTKVPKRHTQYFNDMLDIKGPSQVNGWGVTDSRG